MLARFFWAHPNLYRAIGILRGRGDVLDGNCDALFDGYPRSGNTFGWQMLQVSQDNRYKVKVHQHMPPFLVGGIVLNKPVCLTIRRPIDALASQLIYAGGEIRNEMEQYIDFYTVMLDFRSKILVLPFDVITGDFNSVLALMNFRFKLNLRIPPDLKACERIAFARIDDMWRDKSGKVNELQVGRPHETREARSRELKKEICLPQYEELLLECDNLYTIFCNEYQQTLSLYKLHCLEEQGAPAHK